MTVGQAEDFFLANGFKIEKDRIEALLEYERLLLEWNGKINLVSRRDTSDFFVRHIIGSISFLFTHQLLDQTSLLDVGTGGGLPGIPLAILHPDIRVTMIDSIQKKVRAVEQIVADLHLENAYVDCARVEDLHARSNRRGQKFDYITARAVSTATRVLEWCAPLLAASAGRAHPPSTKNPEERQLIPTGSFILLKGGDLTGELASLGMVVGGGAITVRTLKVQGSGDLLSEKKVIIVSR